MFRLVTTNTNGARRLVAGNGGFTGDVPYGQGRPFRSPGAARMHTRAYLRDELWTVRVDVVDANGVTVCVGERPAPGLTCEPFAWRDAVDVTDMGVCECEHGDHFRGQPGHEWMARVHGVRPLPAVSGGWPVCPRCAEKCHARPVAGAA